MSPVRLALAAVLALSACNQENPYKVQKKTEKAPKGPPPKIVGVDPDRFECTNFVTVAEVSQIAGGEVIFDPSQVTPQPGTPRPCTYILEYKMTEEEQRKEEKERERRSERAERGKGTIDDAMLAWGKSKDKVYGMSFDCREGAHDRTESWFASLPASMMPTDAGPGYAEVAGVGKKAMEAANTQLVFIDDQTPCAVTVSGPDPESRLALAKLIDGKLTLENAPMRPRSVP